MRTPRYEITISEEELEALIEFQRGMHSDAQDSCEYEEAAERKARWDHLRKYRKEHA